MGHGSSRYSLDVNVGDLGEFGLIDRLKQALAPPDARLVLGPGDDAALWASAAGVYTLATTDTMVAGVHFLPSKVAWADVGWKALAVNVSDIAAMGGTPTFALVTLALPPDTPVADIDGLNAGMRECAEAYGVTIAGGDVVTASEVTVTVALMGEPTLSPEGTPLLLRRDAAADDDVIAVTAPIGSSAGGLRALLAGEGERYPALVGAHMRFWPRPDAGVIAVQAGIRCGMDISDGLVQDLGHICRASGVDAELRTDLIPMYDDLLTAYPDEALRLALTGGEDYELLLVGQPDAIEVADRVLRDYLEMDMRQLHLVGQMKGRGEGVVRVLDPAGNAIDVSDAGWDHLRGRAQ
jgi:thiamine-monophosphate kinase